MKSSTGLALLIALVSSCSSPRYIYSGSPPNAAYLKGKGDPKLAGYYSTGSYQVVPDQKKKVVITGDLIYREHIPSQIIGQ